MPTTYGTLKIDFNRCPPECTLCVEACSKVKGEEKIELSRIKTVPFPEIDFRGALTCVQCGQPRCQIVCPVGAIEKSVLDGIVRIDESRCIGCALCTMACPYGGIYYNSQTQKPFSCDLCDGAPKCVEACPHQVITYINNEPVLSSLHEDVMMPGTSACRGCPAELGLRFTLRIMGKNTVIFGAPGCAVAFMHGVDNQAHVRIPQITCLLDNVASSMTGVSRHYKSIGKHANLVAYVGDGATIDIGFQALSGAAERGENFIYICYDNEGYMNTGVQRSSATPWGAKTYTSPVGKMRHGKEQVSKNLPVLMLFHGIPYVATASISHLEDFERKLVKAMNVKEGMAYIHLFTPCTTGWGIPEEQGFDAARLAVETNYFPLWEAEEGKVRLTCEGDNPRPVEEYTRLMTKFSHLTAEELRQIQGMVDSRYNIIKTLASAEIPGRADTIIGRD